jgi:5-hydroxyisourate hydrolase-like protein (transthyretin family)
MKKPTFKLAFRFTLAALLWSTAAFAVGPVTGVVTNQTTGKPAAGDDVVLLRLAQGMQEAGHTKTDAKGKFTLDVPDSGMHLVRVTHDKATYFKAIQEGTQSIDVDVFSAAAKVAGVSEEADVMRIETDASGTGLRVVEAFFLKNESSPQMTQFGDKPFDFYLPAGAVMESSAALAPGGMPVQSAPVPIEGSPNHFAFVFPIRPGETRFQLIYHLPYSGSQTFAPKPTMVTDTVALMMPKSMKFAAAASSPFAPVTDEVDGQTYVARNIQPSQPLEFTVSGKGQLPRDTAQTPQGDAAGGSATAAGAAGGSASGGDLTPSEASARQRADTRPGVGLNNPLDSDGDLEPWAKYKWWILGVLGLLLAGGAGVMLKQGPPGGAAPVATPTASVPSVVSGPGALLQALKDELFEIETDRLSGKLSEAQYREQKAALEVVLRRALARAGDAGASASRIEAEEAVTAANVS